jgi:hypothetical protein
VILDRRQSERRVPRARKTSVPVERRQSKDRRRPPTDEDRSIWASRGYRTYRTRSPDPR